jgi:putative ABC transport system substrate-binding protein
MLMIKKNFLLLGLALSGLLIPIQATAEPILAAITTADLPRYQEAHAALATILKAGGFGDGQLKIFVQKPNADKMSLANSLRRTQAAGAALIVTYGSRATQLAQTEVKDTPLLFVDVYDPVALGVVKSLAAPGANATGVTSKTDLAALVDQLLKIKPVKTIGVLYTKGEAGSEQQLSELKAKAGQAGFKVEAANARNPKEALSLAGKLAGGNDALFLTESIAVAQQADKIVAEAQAKSCIVFSQIPGLVTQGALLGLEADPQEQGKLAAVHALQILQGKQAFLLPVREAKKTKLMINQTAADQLGMTIPGVVAAAVTIVK